MAKKKEVQGEMYLVESPVKEFCGVGAAGVHFANGKAEIPAGWVLDWYREKGYEVTKIQKPLPTAPVTPAEPAAAVQE